LDLTAAPLNSELWSNEGWQGGVWIPSETRAVGWVRMGQLRALQQENPNEIGPPQVYTVVGNRNLVVWPPPAGDTSLVVVYEIMCPAITDSASPSGVELFPAEWRDLCLYQGTAAKEFKDKGDLQAYPVEFAEYIKNRETMCIQEAQGKPQTRDLPVHPSAFPWAESYQ
jgi:hypothetical protein